uniref:Uncharacterized protein n=1 Tax=Arundo donax TaxID=35708 RepID=A0A0A8XYU6_ARUDO
MIKIKQGKDRMHYFIS